MNLRIAWNHVRLYRVALAIVAMLTLAVIGAFALLVPIYALAIGNLILMIAVIWLNVRAYMQWLHEAHGVRAMNTHRFDEAEACFRKSLHWANTLNLDDPGRGRILALLTSVTRLQGNYDAAEEWGRQWRDAEERAWGNDHPRTAHAMEVLAAIYDQIARHYQARPLLENALRIREANQASDLAAYAHCLDALGMLWCRLEQYRQAETYLRRSFDIVQQRLRTHSPDAFAVARHLSLACVHLDKLGEADQLAQAALVWTEKQANPSNLAIAFCLSQLAEVRCKQERFEEAEEAVRRALALSEKSAVGAVVPMPRDWQLLGVIHRHQSRWAEAEDCFREALRLTQEYYAPEDLAIARVLEDYAELLELMGRMDESGTHQNHAKQIRDFHSPFRLV